MRLALASGIKRRLDPSRESRILDPAVLPELWFELSDAELRDRGLTAKLIARLRDESVASEAKAILGSSGEAERKLVWRGHSDWPASCDEMPEAPFVLWLRGERGLLDRPGRIAVVGSRHPTPYGRHAAAAYVEALSLADIASISGLARGIDSCAHRTSLESGVPTIAVLGSGLERMYPKEHRRLAEKIVRTGGLLVSEYPPFASAHPASFPRRNRLIAAFAEALLVVEAGRHSGSLITAEWALRYDRPIWAVPGPFDAVQSEGSHALLRDGAMLADSPASLLRDLGLDLALDDAGKTEEQGLAAEVLASLSRGGKPVEALMTEIRADLPRLLLTLEELRARGRAEERAGGLWFAKSGVTPRASDEQSPRAHR